MKAIHTIAKCALAIFWLGYAVAYIVGLLLMLVGASVLAWHFIGIAGPILVVILALVWLKLCYS